MLRLTLYITGREGADQKPGFGYRSPQSPTPATPSSVNNNTKNTYMSVRRASRAVGCSSTRPRDISFQVRNNIIVISD